MGLARRGHARSGFSRAATADRNLDCDVALDGRRVPRECPSLQSDSLPFHRTILHFDGCRCRCLRERLASPRARRLEYPGCHHAGWCLRRVVDQRTNVGQIHVLGGPTYSRPHLQCSLYTRSRHSTGEGAPKTRPSTFGLPIERRERPRWAQSCRSSNDRNGSKAVISFILKRSRAVVASQTRTPEGPKLLLRASSGCRTLPNRSSMPAASQGSRFAAKQLPPCSEWHAPMLLRQLHPDSWFPPQPSRETSLGVPRQ